MKGKTVTKRMFKLRLQLVISILVSVVIFASVVLIMNSRSYDAIRHVGEFYMEGLSEQISKHFETTISLRLSQLEVITERVSADEYASPEETYAALKQLARANGFDHLALLSESGNVQMIDGMKIDIVSQESFLNALNNDEIMITMGIDSADKRVLLLGVSAVYPMNDGSRCTALIAALPVDYITETLSLEIDESHTYSFIIREDGSFVIRTSVENHANYFDRVNEVYESAGSITTGEFEEQLKCAMKNSEPYSCEMVISGDRRQIYGVKLEHSDWYLLTFMPYGILNNTIGKLSDQWMMAAVVGVTVILFALLTLFFSYRKSTNLYMKALEQARNAAEAAQQKAEKASRAKSEFLSNVSHDIRTPMNAIVGMTAIAMANIDDKKRVKSSLEKIELSGKHLLGLVNNVLDMSKIENGKMTLNTDKVSLSEITDNMVNIVRSQIKAKNQRFDVVIHDIISENIWGDSVRINQVILNILSNAVKFTPDGGAVSLTLSQEPSAKGDDYVCTHLNITDTGIGMSETTKNSIFESFAREDSARVRRIEGTGLGMAITKYIVDAMGGTIEVDSELGKGSEFRVTVDFRKAEIENGNMTLPPQHILVVDDDIRLCESVVEDLRAMGMIADFALDGECALKMIEERFGKDSEYSFILLDWQLPGINGIETARRIHKLLGDRLPILLMSAYDRSDIDEAACDAGIVDFIAKPLFKSTLFYGLKKYTDDNSAEKGNGFAENDLSGLRVLVAEDNELNWEIAQTLFSELGLELDWAQNGKLAFEKFTSSVPGYYKAVFMDIRMPVMNGYEATAAIRSSDHADAKNIPIIAMTADAFSEDVKKCLDCGMNAHVAKPIDIYEIERLLVKLIPNNSFLKS